MFSCEFCENSKNTPFLTKHLGWLLLQREGCGISQAASKRSVTTLQNSENHLEDIHGGVPISKKISAMAVFQIIFQTFQNTDTGFLYELCSNSA